MKFSFITFLLSLVQFTAAVRELMADTLVPCLNSDGITSRNLSVIYNHEEKKLYYNASITVDFEGEIYADIVVYIYGLRAISTTIKPCEGNGLLKNMCPVYAGQIDIESQSDLGSIANDIPGIAFTVPDIDAYAVALVRDVDTSELRACARIEVQNTKTVEHTAIKWVTACLSGVGFFVSALFVFMGTSLDSQSISAVTVLMLQYFQSVAMTDMQAVERVPPIASAWAENVVWSVGIVYAKFLEKIVRWYVQATGGNPATYLTYNTIPVLPQRLKKRSVDMVNKIMSPRSREWLKQSYDSFLTPEGELTLNTEEMSNSLMKRANDDANVLGSDTTNNLIVYRGIDRLAFEQQLEVTSAVITTYIIFIFVCVCVVFIFAVLYGLLMSSNKKQARQYEKEKQDPFRGGEEGSLDFESNKPVISRSAFFYMLLPSLMKGTLLKLWYVAFPSIMVFSMWEWTHVDSAGVVVVSVFMFLICLALVGFNAVRLLFIVRKSINETGSPGFMLYSDPKVLQKFGYLYSMFDVKYYWFGLVYLAFNFVKACFLAFAQKSGQTQALAIFIIELAMFIVVCVFKPFLSKAVNGIQITSHVVTTLNAVFFLFFSNLMTQPLIVNGVMGVIFFILNAAFSLFLLLYIIIYSIWCLVAHRLEGTRADHRPKDDRSSFIYDGVGPTPVGGNEELQALGTAAQADHEESGNAPSWYQQTDAPYGESQNPFEPSILPPVAPYKDESRNSLNDSRAGTMTSDNTFNALNDFGYNKHRQTESRSSFGLQDAQDSSNHGLLNSKADDTKPSKLKTLFRG